MKDTINELAQLYKEARNLLLDIFFPRLCAGCETLIPIKNEEFVCLDCLQGTDIYRITINVDKNTVLCPLGFYADSRLRNIVHSFKYDRRTALIQPISILIKHYLKINPILTQDIGENAVIQPIPLHYKRAKERGFNQSALIAEKLSEATNIPTVDVLIRNKATIPQIRMNNIKERKENVKDCFGLKKGEVNSLTRKNVILVDDIYTSGATTMEAAKILKDAGVKKVYIFVLAKA